MKDIFYRLFRWCSSNRIGAFRIEIIFTNEVDRYTTSMLFSDEIDFYHYDRSGFNKGTIYGIPFEFKVEKE